MVSRTYQRPLPRVRTTASFLPTHHHYLHLLRKGFRAFVFAATRPQTPALTEVHFRLGCSFGSSFLQIPHWLLTGLYSLLRQLMRSFFGHPCFIAYSFPPFRAEIGFPPISCCSYRAHRLKLSLELRVSTTSDGVDFF